MARTKTTKQPQPQKPDDNAKLENWLRSAIRNEYKSHGLEIPPADEIEPLVKAHIDLHELERLLNKGCPHELIPKLLL